MLDTGYDYTKSLLPAGNGQLHAMSGGGHVQEGGANLSAKTIEALFNFEYSEKNVNGLFIKDKNRDSILTKYIIYSFFRKFTASDKLFPAVKGESEEVFLYYDIIKSSSKDNNYNITPYMLKGEKPDILKSISGGTLIGSSNITKLESDNLLTAIFNILTNQDDADSAKRVGQLKMLLSFTPSSVPDKFIPILEDVKGAAKKQVRQLTDEEFDKLAKEFPTLLGGGGGKSTGNFEDRVKALIDSIPKLSNKVKELQVRADKYKADNPAEAAAVDKVSADVTKALTAYDKTVAEANKISAKLAAAAGDNAKEIVITELTTHVNGKLKKAAEAVEKAIAAVEMAIAAAATGGNYTKDADDFDKKIKALNTTIESAIKNLEADLIKISTDPTHKALYDRINLEIKKLKSDIKMYIVTDDLVNTASNNSEDPDERKTSVAELRSRVGNFEAIQKTVGNLQAEVTKVLPTGSGTGPSSGSGSGTGPSSGSGSGTGPGPSAPVVQSEQTIIALKVPYTLMLPVEADNFINLDKPELKDLKKLHYDFGLDYIKDNQKKADFVNNLDKCQSTISSLDDPDCNKFRGIVSEIITNIVGTDINPAGAAAGTAAGGPGTSPSEAATLETEILALRDTINNGLTDVDAKITKITDATKKTAHETSRQKIPDFKAKYPTLEATVKQHVADAADPTKETAEVDALKLIKKDLEDIVTAIKALTNAVDADLSTTTSPDPAKLQTEILALRDQIVQGLNDTDAKIKTITDATKKGSHETSLKAINDKLKTDFPTLEATVKQHVADAADKTKAAKAIADLGKIKTDLEAILAQITALTSSVDADLSGKPADYPAQAKAIDAEIQALLDSIETTRTKLEADIKSISDVAKKGPLETELASFNTELTKILNPPAPGKEIKAFRAELVTAAGDPDKTKAADAVSALTSIRDTLKQRDAELKALVAKVTASMGTGGGSALLGKGIKPKDRSTCYFNGIIQMLNQIPEFVEAITKFDPSNFEATEDAKKELGFFTSKQIEEKRQANKRERARIDAIIAANKAAAPILFDTDDRIEQRNLELELERIKKGISTKYRQDINGQTPDQIKEIIKRYLEIKKDPSKASPENKEIADLYTQFNTTITAIKAKEKEASSKYPGEWRDTLGKIKATKIAELEEDLRKKEGEVNEYDKILKSGTITFDKFINPLNALKNIYTKLNSNNPDKTIEIDDDIVNLLSYKRGEYLEMVGGRLRQEDAKGLLSSIIFDLFQKETKLKQVLNKIIFEMKDTIICELDPEEKEIIITQKKEDGSETETQINSILYAHLPDDKEKQSIQGSINKYQSVSTKTTDTCIDFPLNTAKGMNKIVIPKDNKYFFINLTREYYNPKTKAQGINYTNITIEHEITIDDKQYIAVGALIYEGGIGSGHYLFHSLKQGPDGNSVSDIEYNDSNVFKIDTTHPSGYNVNEKGLLFLYKRKDAMTGGQRRLGLRGKTLRTSRIAPEQSKKRTLKARLTSSEPTYSPGPTQTRRRHLKARTKQSRTERSRVSGRLPIRRAGGK